MIADRDDAKDFFVARIAEEAQSRNEPLTAIEEKMLKWTEVHPIRGIEAEELPPLQKEFSLNHDDAEFEQRMVELLKTAYLRNGSRLDEEYRSAYQLLAKEDHYINVMLQAALGSKLRKKILGLF